MVDMTAIAAALSSVKTATDMAKFIRETDTSLAEAETKLKVADLIGAMADMKMELADAQDLLREKDKTIVELKDELAQKSAISFDGKLYWEEGDEVPFCSVCYESQGKRYHLTYFQATHEYDSFHKCKVCSASFH